MDRIGYDSVHIQENTDQRKPTFRDTSRNVKYSNPRMGGGGKKFAFKLPKLPDLAKCVKKCQKLFYYFGNLKSEGLKICMEFAYCFRQTLGKSDSKKTIKNRYQTFY